MDQTLTPRHSADENLSDIVAQYRSVTPLSERAHLQAMAVMPGGQTRTITHYAPYPVFIAEGKGAHLVDLDGRDYLDLVNNYTSLVHGSRFQPVIDAVTSQLPQGLAFPAPHPLQAQLAQSLAGRLPAVDLVRFTNSGTEAGVLAARVARKATGRRKIVMFEGGYHGSAPPLLDTEPDTVVIPFNDLDRLESALDDNVAAVFAESFLGSGGVIPAAPGFLAAAQDLARYRGSLFVLDEVQSLRTDVHGVQGLDGLRPDLTMMGKVIGGGFPVGALGGGAALLNATVANRSDAIRHAGTFNGHLASMAAGAVALHHLDDDAIARLNGHAERLADSIGRAGKASGLPVTVTRVGSILNVHFLAEVPQQAVQVGAAADLYSALHLNLLIDHVYTTPRAMINLSTAMTDGDVDYAAGAYQRAFERLASMPAIRRSCETVGG